MNTDFSVSHEITAFGNLHDGLTSAEKTKGGSFFVRVVREVSSGLYLVRISGQLLTARSLLPLNPGTCFYADISKNATDCELRLHPTLSAVPSAQQIFLQQNTIPLDALTQRIFAVLIALGIRIEPATVKKIRTVALSVSGHELDAAESAALLVDKSIDLTEDAVQTLTDVIHFGGSRDDSSRHEHIQQFLAQCNNRAGKEYSWFFIPVTVTLLQNKNALLCFCYNYHLQCMEKCVLDICSLRRQWFFEMQNSAKGFVVSTYSEPVLSDAKIATFNSVATNWHRQFSTIIDKITYSTKPYTVISGVNTGFPVVEEIG